MNFDEATLTAKLAALTPSQASIESLAGWCLFYRADAPRVTATWASAYDSAPSDAHRLALLYLANDVLQKSRLNKGPEYLDAFIAPLPPRLRALAASTGDPRSAASAARLLAVMRERAVFGSATGKVLGGGGGGGTKRAAADNDDDEPEPPPPRRKRGARSDLAPAQTALAAAAAAAAHAAALESSLDGVLKGGDAATPADQKALAALITALDDEAAARETAARVLADLADGERAAVARAAARRAAAVRAQGNVEGE